MSESLYPRRPPTELEMELHREKIRSAALESALRKAESELRTCRIETVNASADVVSQTAGIERLLVVDNRLHRQSHEYAANLLDALASTIRALVGQ